jgi:hypothetical protein
VSHCCSHMSMLWPAACGAVWVMPGAGWSAVSCGWRVRTPPEHAAASSVWWSRVHVPLCEVADAPVMLSSVFVSLKLGQSWAYAGRGYAACIYVVTCMHSILGRSFNSVKVRCPHKRHLQVSALTSLYPSCAVAELLGARRSPPDESSIPLLPLCSPVTMALAAKALASRLQVDCVQFTTEFAASQIPHATMAVSWGLGF